MSSNPLKPPAVEVRDIKPQLGTMHWLVIPIGLLLSCLGVFVLEPMLVDFIIQTLMQIPRESRAVPMLTLDLFLNTATLAATLYLVVVWARKPKARASAIVALFVAGLVVLLHLSPSIQLPVWYKWASYASVAIAWWFSRSFYVKFARGA